MTIHKELLEEMISQWNEEQLSHYILKLELREMELHAWLKELRKLRQLKTRALKKPLENGPRDGQ